MRAIPALISAGAVVTGVLLAAHHPLWPGPSLVAFAAWTLLAARRPDLCLFAIPAGLPLLNFSPWSGWLLVDEFDLLVLGAIAGGQAGLAQDRGSGARANSVCLPSYLVAALSLFVAAEVSALWRGLSDAADLHFGWFQAHLEPMNSLRMFKPLMLALMFHAVLEEEVRASPERAVRNVGTGMTVGLTFVTLAVLWERVAYPGFTDFAKPYRAVGLFWEMHVGGAAIDAYFALAAPFAAWAVWRAKTPLRWAAAALLALLTCHACLTTFSRGVYVAVAIPLILLSLIRCAPWRTGVEFGVVMRRVLAVGLAAGAVGLGFAWFGYWLLGLLSVPAIAALAFAERSRALSARWRPVAMNCLAAALLVEVTAVAWTGSFLFERMGQSERDLGSRIAHWAKGLSLMDQPSDWAFGIGLGRFPRRLSQSADGDELPGAVRLGPATPDGRSVTVSGPPTLRRLEGLYALTQRVSLLEGARYRIDFDYRTRTRSSALLAVCEKHLLYKRRCQSAQVELQPGPTAWRHMSVSLVGPELSPGLWFAPRGAIFALSVLGVGAEADFSHMDLRAGDSGPLLSNGDFARELASWFPSAESYFVPWHVDSLYLELLIERGALSLLAFVVVMAWTLRRLVFLSGQPTELEVYLAAALGGVLLIGVLSSVMDAPRTAFQLYFLVQMSLLLCVLPPPSRPSDGA